MVSTSFRPARAEGREQCIGIQLIMMRWSSAAAATITEQLMPTRDVQVPTKVGCLVLRPALRLCPRWAKLVAVYSPRIACCGGVIVFPPVTAGASGDATLTVPTAGKSRSPTALTPCNCGRMGRRSSRELAGAAARPSGPPGQMASAAANLREQDFGYQCIGAHWPPLYSLWQVPRLTHQAARVPLQRT